jgi:hypothetical protein
VGRTLDEVIRSALEDWPLPLRWTVLSAVAFGLVGGIAGLVVGLFAYAPTAWFAVIELGLPSAVLGGFLGLITGAIATGLRRT